MKSKLLNSIFGKEYGVVFDRLLPWYKKPWYVLVVLVTYPIEMVQASDMFYFNGNVAWLEIDLGKFSIFVGCKGWLPIKIKGWW